jgi:hypothetical protein
MRYQTTVGFSIGALILIGVANASGQTWGRPPVPRAGACFYEHVNYGGRYFCSDVGASTEQMPGMNDQISSIRVLGNAEVTVFQDAGFRGQSKTFDSDINDLRRVGLNDRISSYRVDSRGGRGGRQGIGGGSFGMAWGRPSAPGSGVCFYRDVNFGGEYFCAAAGTTAEQVPAGMNDQISSIRVFGNAEVTVFREFGFQGPSRNFGSDMADMRRVGLNDRISSFRVETRGSRGAGQGGGGESFGMAWGRPTVPRSGVCFYRDVDFGGQYFCAAVGTTAEQVPAGMNDQISSIRVFGNAEVIVFRENGFQGQSRRFDSDVNDLRRVKMNDRISSFRVGRRGSSNRRY